MHGRGVGAAVRSPYDEPMADVQPAVGEGTAVDDEPEVSDRILTLPNLITLVRFLCIPLFLYLLLVLDARFEAAVLLEAVAGARAELLDAPTRLGDADHRHMQVAALEHCLQRREDLLVREIAGGAEEDEGVGRLAHAS